MRSFKLALLFLVAAALGLPLVASAATVELSIEATVDTYDARFGNGLPPRIGDRLSIHLAFDDMHLELPAVGETASSGPVPLSFSFNGGGLSFEGTSGSFRVFNANNSAVDTVTLLLSDAGSEVGLRALSLSWSARNFDPGPVDLTRSNSGRIDVNQVPVGGFEARIDSTTIVPEPGTALLLGLGLIALSHRPRS